jgi:hypothetical protein
MKLVSYKIGGSVRIGAVVDDKVLPLNALLPAAEQIPDDMTAFLMAGDAAMQAARKAVETFRRGGKPDAAIALKDADLQAPVPRPGKILMGGATISGTSTSCARRARRAARRSLRRRCRTSSRSTMTPSPVPASR